MRYQVGAVDAPAQPLTWTFYGDRDGGLLPGTTVFSGIWGAQPAADAPSPSQVLCQTGRAQFPAISLAGAVFGDFVLSPRFKPRSGREDQAAGLIVRVQDKDNYYILRANALETNVNFYRYAGGRRSGLKESTAPVLSGRWQELRVEAVGNRFRGFLVDQLVVEASDDTYQAGQVGLWTKADSLTCFDDVIARTP